MSSEAWNQMGFQGKEKRIIRDAHKSKKRRPGVASSVCFVTEGLFEPEANERTEQRNDPLDPRPWIPMLEDG